tara:strand:+ start:5783 stop:7186 length:1404 start_codon:yes stop_codon:yes gene_type:complete
MSKLVYINSNEASGFNLSAFKSDGTPNTAKYSDFNVILNEPIRPPPNHKTRVLLNSATIPYSYDNIREGINDRLLGSISFGAVVSGVMTQIVSTSGLESRINFYSTSGIDKTIHIPTGKYTEQSFCEIMKRLIREKIEYFIWNYINDGTLDLTDATDLDFIGSAMFLIEDINTHTFSFEENTGSMKIDTSTALRNGSYTGNTDYIQTIGGTTTSIVGCPILPYALTLIYPTSINGNTTDTSRMCVRECGFDPSGSSKYLVISNYNVYDKDDIAPINTSYISEDPADLVSVEQQIALPKYQPILNKIEDSTNTAIELPSAYSLTGYICDFDFNKDFLGFNIEFSPLVMNVEGSVEGLFVRCNCVRNSVYTTNTKAGENIIGRIPITAERNKLIMSSPSDNSIYEQIITLPEISNISIKLTDQKGRVVNLNGHNAIYGLQFDFIPANIQDIHRKAEIEILKRYIKDKIL